MVDMQLAMNQGWPFANVARTAESTTPTTLEAFLKEACCDERVPRAAGPLRRACCGRARRATTRPAGSGTAPSTGARP